jgi:hypothetical protein
MSTWREAARLLRQRATEARRVASGKGINDVRAQRLREQLRALDNQAFAAWLEQRRAQELEGVAAECDQRADLEPTVRSRPR